MTMTQERFQQLTDSYGAEPKRWPAAERAAAQAFAEAQPEQARAALFAARMIDAALDMSPAIEVRPALRNAILATAPKPRPRRKGAWVLDSGCGLSRRLRRRSPGRGGGDAADLPTTPTPIWCWLRPPTAAGPTPK
jgi:hypothetical protein